MMVLSVRSFGNLEDLRTISKNFADTFMKVWYLPITGIGSWILAHHKNDANENKNIKETPI